MFYFSVLRGSNLKRQNFFVGYLFIGIGVFFLLKQLKIPIFTDFYSWPTLLIIIGLALLIYSYRLKEYQSLFSGTLILGLGLHFHGMAHYDFWINHWAMYTLIIGIAFIIRSLKTKKGFLLGSAFVIISLIIIFSIKLPAWFDWVYHLLSYIEAYWPIALIILGIYFLVRKK